MFTISIYIYEQYNDKTISVTKLCFFVPKQQKKSMCQFKSKYAMEEEQTQSKNIAIICYLTLIGLVVAFILNSEKKDSFSSFHIRQSLGLAITGFSIGILGTIPILGWMISIIGTLILVFLWIKALISAINGREETVIWLGEKYQEWFKSI